MPSALLAMYAVCGVALFVEPQPHLADVSWPTHAFVTLPKGWVKPTDAMFLVENGRPIAAQIEVVGRWPDNSPKWVHAHASLRYAGGQPAKYEFEKSASAPADIPQSPLKVTDVPGGITVDTGLITLRVGRPFAGVTIADGQGRPVVSGPGGPGLVDARGIAWHAQHDDRAEITVEQQGPAQVTVKASGWYQTAEKRVGPFCRFVTRITACAGSGIVRFDHATIFADDMHRHAIAQLPFTFAIPNVRGYTSGKLRGRFGEKLQATYFAQLSASRLLTIDEQGPNEPRTPQVTGTHDRSPGWFAADLDAGRVVLLTKDFWQKCPKEVKIGRDELVYYAWPKHGALGKPDENSLRPEGIYKFQCFHTGKLLDSRLPSEYVAALEAQTDTRECKADYARAANLEGVAMHNEFALAVLPPSGNAPSDDRYVAALARLYVQNPIARVSPTAVALSGALGPVAASGQEYPAQERVIRDAMLGYAASIQRYGDYGWAIYGNTHHDELMNPAAAGVPGGRPSLHRVWNNNHYQHVSTSWRLYALHGDPRLLEWARTCTDNYASIGQVRYDSMRGYTDGKGVHHPGPGVKFHIPGAFYHCKGLVPWGIRDYGMDRDDSDAGLTGHWSDPSALLFAWLFDANRWAKEGYELWLANVKFPAGGANREVNAALVHAITAYEYQPSDKLLAAIKTMAANLTSVPLVAQVPGPIWEPTWLSRYHELFPDDEAFKKYLVASADALGVRNQGIWTLALSATAYRITGDEKYLRRHAGTLARAARSVFYDPKPDKRWDCYGFGPCVGRDDQFMAQWHRFLAALKDAKIASLPAPDEPGQYLHCPRGTKILVLNDAPGSWPLDLEGSTISGGSIHATSLEVLSPRGARLLKIDRLAMSQGRPTIKPAPRPSTWHAARESYSINDAGPGLYSVLFNSYQFGAFQPLTGLPECEVLSASRKNPRDPWYTVVQISRGYLVPLVQSRIVLKFTAMGPRDGSYLAIHDRQNKPVVAQWIRAGDSLQVTLGGQGRGAGPAGPWLFDTFSDHTGFIKMEVTADVDEPLFYGANLKHIELIRQRLGR
jgi:hypothetical protein